MRQSIESMPTPKIGDCPAIEPSAGYLCTRDRSHSGSHIADTLDDVCAIWDDDLAWTRSDGWRLIP